MNAIGESWYRAVLDQLYDGLYTTDLDRLITFWNEAASRLSGFDAASVIGRRCSDNVLIHVDDNGTSLCQGRCPLAATMEDGEPREARVYLHHKEGHRLPVWVRTAPIRDGAGQIVGGTEIFAPDSTRVALEDQVTRLQQMTMLDDLTQLPNRRYLDQRLLLGCEETRRADWPMAVLMIDVDHFKSVNDRLGHLIGDRVLKIVARTLQQSLRSPDIVGRWGGEEFLVIAQPIPSSNLGALAERLRSLIEASSIPLDTTVLNVTVSVGATSTRQSDTPESVVARADALLYRAKEAGRNRVVYELD